jgi:CubicO group peptidase (beta-lactamase class C family)
MKRVTLLAVLILPHALAAQQSALDSVADRVFAPWTTQTPGCAAGVARAGQTVLARGYGMADLETNTPITAQTIFESGSVAKQFTATATLLLALDGKLSLDDNVRKYVPELPVYSRPILIRHLLNHTSGLREWSNLVGLQGWPRGLRAHTQSDLLAVVGAQKNLNYPVGDYYSYTNSGFALLETIVERVSGQPFAQFTAERIFQKLGMTHTRWRDDFRTLVPGRAQAYSRTGGQSGPWQLDMPFENVVGPGGLLTTVGDWLIWNDALDKKTLGPAMDSLTVQGVLTSGRRIDYARGLIVTHYRGLDEISHSGSTAGYSTFLTRYPSKSLSIAILCNASGANATQFAHQLVDAIVPDLPAPERPDTVATDPAVTAKLAGVYRSLRTHEPQILGDVPGFEGRGGRGRGGRGGGGGGGGGGGAPIRTLKDGRYLVGNARVAFDVGPDGRPRGVRVFQNDGDTLAFVYAGANAWAPTAQELAQFTGPYRSNEINMSYGVAVDSGALVVTVRGDQRRTLAPVYRDAFTGPGLGVVWFTRNAAGMVTAMHLGAARVWDLEFMRLVR